VVGSASGELDGLFSFGKVPLEVIVEELTSVITIEAEDGEWEGFFDIFDLSQDSCFALSPDGTLFCPAGGDIYEVDGIGVHSGSRITTMSDGICFKKAWA